MKDLLTNFIKCIILFFVLNPCNSARIIAILPHPGKSHFEAFRPLLNKLADRGHNVTVVSLFPQTEPPFKYKDISLPALLPIGFNSISFQSLAQHHVPTFLLPYLHDKELSDWGLSICEALLPSQQIQALLKNTDQYDLAITELFNTDCFLGVVHQLQVPFIALSSCVNLPWAVYRFGHYEHPAFVPNAFLGISDYDLTFLGRLENTLLYLLTALLHPWLYTKPTEEVMKKYIGQDVPPLEELRKQTALLLVNTHFTLHPPRPLPPSIIEVGGMHVQPAKPLPEELNTFVEGSKGVVVFTLGSMIKTDTMPEEMIKAFVEAFKVFEPIKFVWKFHKNITNLPENVLILPWIPQRDLLDHKNVRAFMTHGGLLGLTEAIHSGKPIIATPLFGDQFTNVASAVRQGIAVELNFLAIDKNSIVSALTAVLAEEYQIRARKLGEKVRSRPLSPLDTAVFWTEHVLEHGSDHLRMYSTNLHWTQLLLLDVAIVFLIIGYLLLRLIKLILNKIYKCIKQDNSYIDEQKNK